MNDDTRLDCSDMESNEHEKGVCDACGTAFRIPDGYDEPESGMCWECQLAAERAAREKAEGERDTQHAAASTWRFRAEQAESERDAAQAACAAMLEGLKDALTELEDMPQDRVRIVKIQSLVDADSPGSAFLARLQRAEAVVERLRNDVLASTAFQGREILRMDVAAYRAAVLGKENTNAE